MIEVKTNKGVVLVRETIKELPIDRFTDAQKYFVQDSGIGSTMADVANHFNRLDMFLSGNKIDDAKTERYNLHYNLFLMLEGVQITHYAFAVFVDSINGEPINDYSENGLKRVCEKLGKVELGRDKLEEVLSGIKKKLIAN